MIVGMHAIIYSQEAEKVRAFFKEVLKFPSVDVGGRWLIFGAPPSELAVHPTDGKGVHELFFMTDDVKALVAKLEKKGYRCAKLQSAPWGLSSSVKLPGGDELGIY